MSDQELIEQYIEPNPDRPEAANARIAGYSVPVWALVGYLEAVHGDVGRVARDYDTSSACVIEIVPSDSVSSRGTVHSFDAVHATLAAFQHDVHGVLLFPR